MFTSPSPLVSPYGSQTQSQNPYETEMIMKQKYSDMARQQRVISNPYIDFQNEIQSCTPIVKDKILQDESYKSADYQCELLIQQAITDAIIPQLLNIPDARVAFEKLLATTRQLKAKYQQDEVSSAQAMQTLLSDPVVQQRLKELSNNSNPQSQQPQSQNNNNQQKQNNYLNNKNQQPQKQGGAE